MKMWKIFRKFSNFLNEVLSNTCCRATIILPDSNICEWNSEYVTSELNLTDHLVDPQTGIVEVTNITVIMLKSVLLFLCISMCIICQT